MKNKLTDLNDHLFAQLERLSDESRKPPCDCIEEYEPGKWWARCYCSNRDDGEHASVWAADKNREAEMNALRDTITFLRAELERKDAALLNGNRPLPLDRETLGRMVREVWVRWAETQPSPKPSWLVPYEELSETDKEADRQIGEAIARWTLIHDAARAALSPAKQETTNG